MKIKGEPCPRRTSRSRQGRGRRIRWIVVAAGICAALLGCGLSASAETPEELFEQQRQASGADEWWEQMPQDIRDQLAGLGITGIEMESLTALQPETVGQSLWNLLLSESGSPLRMGGILLGALMICALVDGMRTLTEEPAVNSVFQTIGMLIVCGTTMLPLLSCIRRVSEAVTGSAVFMGSFVPVYTAVLASSGQMTSALSYQSVVLWVSELMTVLIRQWITPLMTVSLAFGIVGNMGVPWRLSAVSDFFNKICSWVLGLIGTVFTGMLSLQNLAGTAADTLSVKAIRFSVANLVPVVGGAISEALGTVKGCLSVLKTTLGGVSIVSTAFMLLPPLLSCAWWILVLSLCGTVADVLSMKSLGAMLRTVAGTIKTLIGILASCGLFMIVATAIVTKAGTGGV